MLGYDCVGRRGIDDVTSQIGVEDKPCYDFTIASINKPEEFVSLSAYQVTVRENGPLCGKRLVHP